MSQFEYETSAGESNILFPVGYGKQAGTRAFLLRWVLAIGLNYGNKDTKTAKKDRFMRKLNNEIKIDRAIAAVENVSTGEEPMSNSSKKTPWYLRFTPSRLRKKAIIAIIAVVAVLTPVSAMALNPVVTFIIGWVAGQTLTAAKKATIDKWLAVKKATASVNGAYWTRNYYRHSLTGDGAVDLTAPYSYRRIIARQGHELTGTASGTRDGVAMEEEEAENYLQTQDDTP